MIPAIFGIESTKLNEQEISLFKKYKPAGFILFSRNIENELQIKELCESFNQLVEHNPLILIDQEGGRVARLRPPNFRETKPIADYANLKNAKEAVKLNMRLIGEELHKLGINTNCAPMLDVRAANADNIIGDRALGNKPEIVTTLGEAVLEGLNEAGILPIIKHIPGHGKATVDSHLELPIVNASLEQLEQEDFFPFKKLNHAPFAMTAHIIYSAIDDKLPATLSPSVIHLIREEIGFKGLLMTDDLGMKALSGNLEDNALKALKAGCDIALHCDGNFEDMQKICEKLASKADISMQNHINNLVNSRNNNRVNLANIEESEEELLRYFG